MAPNADPFRTLGLAPGATQDEIRRAYRRLAKINHPDAAGDGALPRFLAIQAAYEQLAGPGRARRVGARPASRPTDPGPATGPREPWRADPDRARASGRADGRRTPGARPGTRPSGPAGPGAGPSPGAAGSGGRTRGRGADSTSPGTGPGMRPGAGAEGEQARRSSSRRRPANRATPGSTSYEGADQEPFEPGWTGATWYGASSGTYWTINPKEYADPRKHGPEYQARARRARDGSIPDETLEAGPAGPPDPGPADPEPGDDGADRPSPGDEWADRPSPDADSTGDGADTSPPRPFAADWASRRPGGRRHWMDGRPPSGATASPGGAAAARRATATADPSAAAGASDPTSTSVDPNAPGMPSARPARGPGERGPAGPADPAGPAGPPGGGLRSWIEQPPADAPFRGPLLRRPTTPTGRLAMALLGWPPLGVFAAAAIDQSTGCGAFAASCPEVSSPGTWIVQAAIFLFLLALPAVAAWSAHGAIATLVVGVPTAVVLSAAGGTNVREASAPILLAVLAIAYLAGVAYAAVVGRRRPGAA